jgi:uncharacterized membrane protein
MIDQKAGLFPHEEGLLEMLFGEKGDRSSSIKLSKVSKKITGSGWKIYKKPLKAEIEAAGFLSESRQKARSNFFGLGILLLVLGVMGIVTTAIWGGSLGFGPWAVIIAVMLLGVAGMILGSALVPFSYVGTETAGRWKKFSNYLNDVAKGKQAVGSPMLFENYLPYAAAFGLTKKWAKRSEKEGWTEVPPYFRVAPGTTNNQTWMVFIYLQGAFNSSGGSAAGSAGAGAAGGGSSGAG